MIRLEFSYDYKVDNTLQTSSICIWGLIDPRYRNPGVKHVLMQLIFI